MSAPPANHPPEVLKGRYSLRSWLFMVFGGFLIVMFVTISLIRSFGIPWIGLNGSYQDIQAHTVEEFNLLADLKKEHLQLWLRERRSDLDLLAKNQDMVQAVGIINQAHRMGMELAELLPLAEYRLLESRLRATVSQYPSLTALHLIDPVSMMIVVSSSPKFLQRPPANEAKFVRFVHSTRPNGSWFVAGNEPDSSHMKLARRLKDPAGGTMPLAVLVSQVNIEEILLPMLHTGRGLGTTGEVILVNHNQQILTPLKHMLSAGKVAQVGDYRIEDLSATLASRGKEGLLFTDDYRGVPVLACFRHIDIDGDVGWGMIVKQDMAEIDALAWQRLRMSSLVGLAGLFFALVGSALFARYLANPIRSLTEAATRLSKGDFSQRVQIRTNYREVVELSTAFNSMTERLSNWDTALHHEIAIKTRQLTDELNFRKGVEEALKESEQTLTTIFDAANDGILVADAETLRLTRGNKAICEMLGYSEEELEGVSVNDIHPPEDLPHVIAVFEKQLRGELTLARDIPVQRKDGSHFLADISSSPLLLFGRPHLLGLFRDISEQKRAEAERDRLMMAIEQSGEAIIVTDAQGNIEYVNPMFETVSGYNRKEAMGQNPRILRSGHQDESFYREMWETLVCGLTWKGRIVNKRKDGSLYTEDTTISPVFDSTNKIINYMALKRDVTEHLLVAKEKANLEAQLRQVQKMDSIGQLAGGVAHDFNNMLGVILGYGEIILSELPPGAPLREDVMAIVDAGRRSAALTRQLLAFSRKQTMQPEILDLNAVVLDIESMLCRLMGEDIELEKQLKAGLFRVKADLSQIEQVIVNLVVNSRDAMPDGGKLIIATDNVTVNKAFARNHPGVQPGEHVLFSVTDTGHGMDEETASRVFEPFFTTKVLGKGTGLGLATVYGIVRQSDGTIWASSQPGMGTTFSIYLPKATEKASAKPVTDETPKPKQGVRGENILIVEDEKTLRDLLRVSLSKIGYTITEAADGNEAIRLIKEKGLKPDLVISDVIMPGISGSQLAQHIREIHPDTKVLYMSGYTGDTIAHHGVLDEDVHFIQKPFTLKQLAAKVREFFVADEPTAGS